MRHRHPLNQACTTTNGFGAGVNVRRLHRPQKSFGTIYRGRCVQILRDHGVGQKALRLITTCWKEAVLVRQAGGSYGLAFKALRDVTQGGPLLPRIFNIMVDAVVREWLRQIMSDEAAIERVGNKI